jgi:sugar phosphate isomerase/epimerase
MRIVPLPNGYIAIGLQTYKRMPLEAPFDMAKKEQCHVVEVFFDKDLTSGFYPRDLHGNARKFIRDSNMFVCVHAPMLDFASQGWQNLLADSVQFGDEIQSFALTMHPPADYDKKVWQDISAIVRTSALSGRVMLENTPELGGPGKLDIAVLLLSDLLATQVGVTFDCGHANLWSGHAHEFLRQLKSPVWHLHLHDNRGERDEHLSPGKGTVNFQSILQLLSQRSFCGTGIIEYWRPQLWSEDIGRLQRWGMQLFEKPAPPDG